MEEAEGVLLDGTFRFGIPGSGGAYRIRGRHMGADRSFNLTPLSFKGAKQAETKLKC